VIKLKDYTDKLHRLHHMGASEDKIVAEFDRICEVVFGATLDDVSDPDRDRLRWEPADVNAPEAHPWFPSVAYCLDHGVDLRISNNHPVRYWEHFAQMVRARVLGMLPATPEERAQHRLQAEAREFQESSKGTIRG